MCGGDLSKSKFKLGNIVGLKTAVQILLLVLLSLWHSKRNLSQNLIHFRWIYWTSTAWFTEGFRVQKRTRASLHTQTSDEADLLRGRNEGLVCQTGKIAPAVHLAPHVSDLSKSNHVIIHHFLTGNWWSCDPRMSFRTGVSVGTGCKYRTSMICVTLVLLLDAIVAPIFFSGILFSLAI